MNKIDLKAERKAAYCPNCDERKYYHDGKCVTCKFNLDQLVYEKRMHQWYDNLRIGEVVEDRKHRFFMKLGAQWFEVARCNAAELGYGFAEPKVSKFSSDLQRMQLRLVPHDRPRWWLDREKLAA